MVDLILKRLFTLPFIIFSITFITFIVGYLAPGDPILVMMGARQDAQIYEQLRREYGLDRPWYEQYLNYAGGLLRGDLGLSFRSQGRSVWEIIQSGVPVSVALGLSGLVLSLAVGIPLGIAAAIRHNSTFDRLSMGIMLSLYAIPSFVLIPILQWLNYQSYVRGGPSLPVAGWGRPLHWIMPVLVLSAATMGYIARLTRATMLDVLREDYIVTARSKGLTERRVRWGHAFRNALLPIVTVVGPAMAFLVTGAFVVENLFAIPGVGYVSIQAIEQRDYPVIQGTTVILAVAVVIMNLLTDIAYVILDPRVRVES
jgi:ABC-type dipeptide/oligopeptide/nickel transport system permease component